jgi:glycosyltransferase 2 family protein
LKNKVSSAIKYLLLLFVGFGLLWLAFRKENLSEVWDKMAMADPFWLGASVVLALFAFVSRGVRWVMLMEPLGYKPKLSNTLYALFLGYFANLAIPRIGEITRCGALASVEKVPFNSLIGTVIVERTIDLLMLFVTIVLVAILEFDMLSTFIIDKILIPIMGNVNTNSLLLLGLTGVVIVVLLFFLGRRFLFDKNNESPFKIKMRKMLKEVVAGLQSVLKMKNTGWFIFHTFFIWFIYFLMTWVCFFCLEATSHLDIKAGLFILVVGGLGMSAPVQGGIGAYHYIVSQGLQLFNVSSTDGIVYATLVHTTQTLLVIVLGLWAMLKLFLIRKKNSANG